MALAASLIGLGACTSDPAPLNSVGPRVAVPVPPVAWSVDSAGFASGGVDLSFTGGYELGPGAVAFDGVSGFGASAGPGPVATDRSFSVSAWVSLLSDDDHPFSVA